MKFGLALPYNITRQAGSLAKLAEEAGWDGLFLGDAVWTEDPMIALAAAAVSTTRIRLGTMIIPVPLRRPWKIASEALALDLLSGGRMTLGLATGAVWMGWQGFPGEATGVRQRGEMLDETIDILALLFQGKPFDYHGKHFQLELTKVDEMYYPPRPVQQPRIPLWAVGIWPGEKSMQRALKCDGLIAEKRNPDGSPGEVTPEDVQGTRAYLATHGGAAHQGLTAPFDIIVNGSTRNLDADQAHAKIQALGEAGATWWIEGLWEAKEEALEGFIQNGPPDGANR